MLLIYIIGMCVLFDGRVAHNIVLKCIEIECCSCSCGVRYIYIYIYILLYAIPTVATGYNDLGT